MILQVPRAPAMAKRSLTVVHEEHVAGAGGVLRPEDVAIDPVLHAAHVVDEQAAVGALVALRRVHQRHGAGQDGAAGAVGQHDVVAEGRVGRQELWVVRVRKDA